eukprot:TRINITY_DN18661_c0_g3_i1.p1 TRINITY_DN18661_c0_g3~~TRINITY_DN18661_c0_g3_i1.p1  ORF type:complete len:473 (+),score=119.86 TRINITY_DN18661_c0_g3_i1:45-1463(+)
MAAPRKAPPGPPPKGPPQAASVRFEAGNQGRPPPPPGVQQPAGPAQPAGALQVRGLPNSAQILWCHDPRTDRSELVVQTTDSTLLSYASNMLQDILGIAVSEAVPEEDTDRGVERAVLHRWGEVFALRTRVTVGSFSGLTALGVGTNSKTRLRTSRLALAVAALARGPPGSDRARLGQYYTSAEALVREAREALTMEPASVPRPPPGAPPANLQQPAAPAAAPPPAAADPWATSAAAASDPWAQGSTPSATTAPGAQPTGRTLPVDPCAPPECLRDPCMELREFPNSPGTLWPYCTMCSCWSDSGHVGSKGHTRRMTNYGYVQQADGVWRQPGQVATPQPQPQPQPRPQPADPWQQAQPQQQQQPQDPWQQRDPWQQPQTAQPQQSRQPPPPPQQLRQPPQQPRPESQQQQQQPVKEDVRQNPAPPMPTLEEIYEWNAHCAHFDWTTVEGPGWPPMPAAMVVEEEEEEEEEC